MITTNRWSWLLFITIIIYFSLALLLGFSRYWGYMSSINDLGHYDHAVWGLQFQPFFSTPGIGQGCNFLGVHFNPVLLLFVPLYAIFSNVIWLTIAQALALSLAAWPIFLLANRICQSEKIGFLWSLVYLMNPFLLNAAAWDFHPVMLAVPFVALGMLAIETERPYLLFGSTLFILLCKEHFGVMAVGFGLLWYIRNRTWKPTLCLVVIGIIHSFIVLGVIIPAFSSSGDHYMLAGRYSWLGHSMGEVLEKLFTDPFSIIKTAMIDFKGALYLALLFAFFCAFPLLAPEFLLPGLADLAANILSSNPMPKSLIGYHSATLIPVFIMAAIYGVKRISTWQTRYSLAGLACLAVVISFIGGYMFAPLPLPGAHNFWAPVHFPNWPDSRIQAIRSLVSDNASVSVQANIGSHFSQRHKIYRYPNMIDEVDAVILRLESPTKNINNLAESLMKNRKDYLVMLDSHLQMDRIDYIRSIRSMLYDKKYGILFWDDPWLVLSRKISNRDFEQKIKQKLDTLQKEWKIDYE